MAIPYNVLRELGVLGVKINKILETYEQLNMIVRFVNRVLKTDFSSVLLIDEATRRFIKQPPYQEGAYKCWLHFTSKPDKIEKSRIGTGFTDWVLKHKKIKVLNGKGVDKKYKHALMGARSEICLPLIVDGKI